MADRSGSAGCLVVALAVVVASVVVPGRLGLGDGHVGASVGGSFYGEGVMASGPVGYWRLGNASGDSANEVAGGEAVRRAMGVTRGVGGALLGDGDTAYRFSATNGAGLHPGDDVSVTTRATVEGWVKLEALPAAATTVLSTGHGDYTGPEEGCGEHVAPRPEGAGPHQQPWLDGSGNLTPSEGRNGLPGIGKLFRPIVELIIMVDACVAGAPIGFAGGVYVGLLMTPVVGPEVVPVLGVAGGVAGCIGAAITPLAAGNP